MTDRHRYLITEALLAVAQAARLVANGDTAAMPKLIQALEGLDEARAAAAEELGRPLPAILENQAETIARATA